jgi:5-deoxy-glucuronate isomerase
MPEDTDTWARGVDELQDTTRRNVRTCFDLSNAPYSNMVLGEVVNLPGRWSSYPPHWHPQPEVYFYRFDKPQGYGANWCNGKVVEIGHNGLSVITEQPHPVVACPGYALCYAWGIRHLEGNPWDKTRIDDETHEWMLDPNATFWEGNL